MRMTYTGGGGKGQRKGADPPQALLTLNGASGMIISFSIVIKEKSPHDRGNGLSCPWVPVGFLLRRKPLAIKITDQVLTWSVRILLLLLGLALGADDSLISQMDTIGARASSSACAAWRGAHRCPLLEPVMNRHVGHYAVSAPQRTKGRRNEGIHHRPVLFQRRRAWGQARPPARRMARPCPRGQQLRRIRHARRRGHEPRLRFAGMAHPAGSQGWVVLVP